MCPLPFVSVIVPVWNSPELIRKCLSAVSAQTYPRDRYEILVVDNGSTDSTGEAVRSFPFAILLHEPRPGSYHARNFGLTKAKGEFIAFTDADCIPAPDWLEKGIARARQDPKIGVVAGQIDLFDASPNGSAACALYEKLFAFRQDIGARKGFSATANWISPRETLSLFGGFQADRKSGADGELANRIHSAGYPIVFAPDVIVQHPIRGTFAELAKKRRRLTGGRWERTSNRYRFVRILSIIVWETLRRLKAIVSEPGIGLMNRAKITWLIVALSGVAFAELLRLAANREASRA
jgi:glycosyltransferase involved in cell wall biosynthesis